MKQRLLYLIRLYITLILIFVTQKIVFMLVNIGHADGASFGSCVAVLWHGLRLDSVAACYVMIVPLLIVIVSCFFRRFALRKVLMPYYVVAALFMTLVFAVDTILYFFWGSKFDAAELFYAADPAGIFASLKVWVIVVSFAAVGAIAWHYLRRLRHATPEGVDRLHNRWAALMLIPAAALVFLGMRGSVSQSTANPSFAYFSQYTFCNHAALNPLFNFTHSLFKTKDLSKEFNLMPAEEAEAAVAPCYATDNGLSDTLLNRQRPDILLIIWEGGGKQMVLNDSVAPNLMRYCNEGVFFSNCYSNSFRTDRGVLSLLSGWVALPTTSLMKMNDKCQRLPGLAEALHAKGYDTRFIYGGDIDFTNMRGYLHEVGFQTVGGSSDFPESRGLSAWGAPDAYTLRPDVLGYDDEAPAPRFDVVLTLSSHEPWQVPMRRLADEHRNAFCYTDSCIAVLVDSLRRTPRWNNLLVVIVPDHGVPTYAGQGTGDPAVAPIPMVWTGGAVRGHKEVGTVMNQSDLAATLLAQMGIEHSDFPFSRNVLSPAYADQYHFALHSFKGGCNLFDEEGVATLDCNDISISGPATESKRHFFKALLQYIYLKSGQL